MQADCRSRQGANQARIPRTQTVKRTAGPARALSRTLLPSTILQTKGKGELVLTQAVVLVLWRSGLLIGQVSLRSSMVAFEFWWTGKNKTLVHIETYFIWPIKFIISISLLFFFHFRSDERVLVLCAEVYGNIQ